MKKTLPSIRLHEQTLGRIRVAINKYNEKNLVQLSMQEFRRIAYEYLSQIIIQDKPLNLKLSH